MNGVPRYMEQQPTSHENILLFDADCAPCSRVAKRLKALNVSGLETRSFNEPEITEALTRAGHEIPDKPALLEVDGGSVKLYQGFPMRLKLARRIGFRKAGAIVGLLAEEARARAERAAEQEKVMTRRRLMGCCCSGRRSCPVRDRDSRPRKLGYSVYSSDALR